ncbi:hypothetical protein [Trujillonella endophytica]|uniref:Uncharacterized protein n=1 Tax=Trujillonella endophytica TaxID=673521 RepID=A0A1H8RZX1_9ACTN|nr:hypothetical protein [Trujillella endophytica]SEO71493.1 hypothetical protein SAMN05660991_01428 [Trujillella endophytica]
MRWQRLFADLQAEWEAEEVAAERAEDASRTRLEIGAIHLADRLGGAVGRELTVRCRGLGDLRGLLTEVGAGWLLVTEAGGREVLVALAAVRSVTGLDRGTAAPTGGEVVARLDLRWALRGLARDRSPVQVLLDDGGTSTGTVDRVGADFLELAEHAGDEPRRTAAVHGVRAIALDAVAAVRRLAPGLD